VVVAGGGGGVVDRTYMGATERFLPMIVIVVFVVPHFLYFKAPLLFLSSVPPQLMTKYLTNVWAQYLTNVWA